MHRRAFVSLAAVVPLAGCSGLLGGGGVDTTLSDDERVGFDAEEGAELTVTVEVQELDELGDDIDLERQAVSLRIDHDEHGLIDAWNVEDSETFDLTIEHGGAHTAMITGGTADLTIE
ncbi:hypothetical protein [Halopiger goleimassiliensis]|uniref:hypothetical protein n=1 Tax=Halopiger goleimassiliensis TaxID=1293048 RepID=UPI0006779898|nr:hypothetical protein [Halopiger goleimassiliensis]